MTPDEYAILFGDATNVDGSRGSLAVSELPPATSSDDITIVLDEPPRSRRSSIGFKEAAFDPTAAEGVDDKPIRTLRRNPFLWALLTGGVAIVIALGLILLQASNAGPKKLTDPTDVIYPAIQTDAK
jgi:hypothetical protein